MHKEFWDRFHCVTPLFKALVFLKQLQYRNKHNTSSTTWPKQNLFTSCSETLFDENRFSAKQQRTILHGLSAVLVYKSQISNMVFRN